VGASLSRSEVSQILSVDEAAVDALIESGRILCHVKRGEARIPIEQLEAFLRDSLVRLYRAEAAGQPMVFVREPESVQHQPEPEPPPAPPVDEVPEVEASERVMTLPGPIPTTPGAEWEDDDRPDHRVASRFVPLRQIDGIFGETKFSLLQISATGLRIKHNDALLPGTEAKVSFALMKPARSFMVRARVVWTSIAHAGENRFSISGLRVTAHQERLTRAIDLLKSANELQPERRAQVRRASDAVAVEEISDDEIALVTSAIQKFAADPVEASRWYSRARFSTADENVRKAAPERPRDREEVLGIWEYLEHQVEIPKIAGIVGWMRQAG
jgi:hypothetical protein